MSTFDLFAGDFATSWVGVADVVVKATVLFLSAGVASFLLRRRSAALRHIIWTLALAGVLVLPMLSMALPHWQLNLVTIDQASLSAPSFQFPASSLEATENLPPSASRQAPAPRLHRD